MPLISNPETDSGEAWGTSPLIFVKKRLKFLWDSLISPFMSGSYWPSSGRLWINCSTQHEGRHLHLRTFSSASVRAEASCHASVLPDDWTNISACRPTCRCSQSLYSHPMVCRLLPDIWQTVARLSSDQQIPRNHRPTKANYKLDASPPPTPNPNFPLFSCLTVGRFGCKALPTAGTLTQIRSDFKIKSPDIKYQVQD